MEIHPFRKLLCANRGEIADPRVPRRAELGIRTVAIYSDEDRFAPAPLQGRRGLPASAAARGPVAAYLDIDGILDVAKRSGVDAIHPGYGFLSENADFARACEARGHHLRRAARRTCSRTLGRQDRRAHARRAGRVSRSCPAPSYPSPTTSRSARGIRRELGFPVIVKAAHRRRRPRHAGRARARRARRGFEQARSRGRCGVRQRRRLPREARPRARHIEVQILGDRHGNVVHLYERDCSVQRRHQKVVEIAPAPNLDRRRARPALRATRVTLARAVGYHNAGTVEFLVDATRPSLLHRGQPAHPGRAHRHRGGHRHRPRPGADPHRGGARLGTRRSASSASRTIRRAASRSSAGSRPRTRRTTSCPTTAASRLPLGRPASASGSTAAPASPAPWSRPTTTRCWSRSTAYAPTLPPGRSARDCARCASSASAASRPTCRSSRTCSRTSSFRKGETYTRFIDETPELFELRRRARPRDPPARLPRATSSSTASDRARRAARACRRSSSTRSRRSSRRPAARRAPRRSSSEQGPRGSPSGCRTTSCRCSPTRRCATRTRACSRRACARATSCASRRRPRISCRSSSALETWGGATFDVAYRFLNEDPWDRLRQLKRAMPNVLHADAAARRQRRRLHELPGQRRRGVHRRGRRCGHRRVPRVRQPERPRQHAGRGGARHRDRQGRGGLRLLHRRRRQPARGQVRRSTTTAIWPSASRTWARTSCASRTWRACCARTPRGS